MLYFQIILAFLFVPFNDSHNNMLCNKNDLVLLNDFIDLECFTNVENESKDSFPVISLEDISNNVRLVNDPTLNKLSVPADPLPFGYIYSTVSFANPADYYNDPNIYNRVVSNSDDGVTRNVGIGYLVFTKKEILTLFNSTGVGPLIPGYEEERIRSHYFGGNTDENQTYTFCFVKSKNTISEQGLYKSFLGIVPVDKTDRSTITNPEQNVGFINFDYLPCPPYCSSWSSVALLSKELEKQKACDLISTLIELKELKKIRKLTIEELKKYKDTKKDLEKYTKD